MHMAVRSRRAVIVVAAIRESSTSGQNPETQHRLTVTALRHGRQAPELGGFGPARDHALEHVASHAKGSTPIRRRLHSGQTDRDQKGFHSGRKILYQKQFLG
jgi:hypothetical protein